MLYYVRTGDLDCTAHATSHRHAAIKAVRNCGKDLGVCLVVNEREIKEGDESGNVYFLTENILEDCELRLVG